MICLVFVFEFVFVTGLHGTFLLLLLVPFTPYDLSRQCGIHIARLKPLCQQREDISGRLCMCVPHARGSMAHGSLHATVYCTAQSYIVKENARRDKGDDFHETSVSANR